MEVPPESEENASARPRMVHYYYINYKQFVNVVKYKLDMMRKKLESDDKMASCKQGGEGDLFYFASRYFCMQQQNRTSYKCPRCDKTFSDLDVKNLYDLSTGELRLV